MYLTQLKCMLTINTSMKCR